MCKSGTSIKLRVPIPAHLSYTGEFRWDIKGVDACIAGIVQALNDAGIYTAGCCCGHGKHDGNIILHDGRELILPVKNQYLGDTIMAHEADIYLAGEAVECSLEDFKQATQAEHNCCFYILSVRWLLENEEVDNIVAVIADNIDDAVGFFEDFATDDWDLLSFEEINI